MKQYFNYKITFLGHPLVFQYRYGAIAQQMAQFASKVEVDSADVFLTDDEWNEELLKYKGKNSEMEIENAALMLRASNRLLQWNLCLFHGTAFLWRGKAWIFCAPSGTGKTTQYALWKYCYGEEVTIINGDKPLMELTEKNEIIVHPSPWRGKEGMGSEVSAPLGGIIYLQQGSENRIERMDKKLAVPKLFRQFLFHPDNFSTVRKIAKFEDVMISEYPVWYLTNRGDVQSAKLAHDTIL